MKDSYYIDEVPVNEPCAQVGSANYYHLAMIELQVHSRQLIRQFGEPPTGSFFKTQANPHDLGTYYMLLYVFDDENQDHLIYALALEDGPVNWDTKAIAEIIDKDPHYFDLVAESNKIKSPRLSAFVEQINKIMHSA